MMEGDPLFSAEFKATFAAAQARLEEQQAPMKEKAKREVEELMAGIDARRAAEDAAAAEAGARGGGSSTANTLKKMQAEAARLRASALEAAAEAAAEAEAAEEDADPEQQHIPVAVAEEALRQAYESAARIYAWGVGSGGSGGGGGGGLDSSGVSSISGVNSGGDGEDGGVPAADAAGQLLSGAEAFLLRVAWERFAHDGADGAAAAVDFARGLVRAQECLPPWVCALTAGGSPYEQTVRGTSGLLEFARCWREACARVEDEIIAIAHSQ